MSAKTIDIVTAIRNLTTLEEIKEINDAVSLQWTFIQLCAAKSFRKGDKVTFTGKGTVLTGVVEKVNQKTVAVKTGPHQTWRVSPNLLKKVA